MTSVGAPLSLPMIEYAWELFSVSHEGNGIFGDSSIATHCFTGFQLCLTYLIALYLIASVKTGCFTDGTFRSNALYTYIGISLLLLFLPHSLAKR